MSYIIPEYKIIQGLPAECQKWLNQWRHEFNLKIIQMCYTIDNKVVILLLRSKADAIGTYPTKSPTIQ